MLTNMIFSADRDDHSYSLYNEYEKVLIELNKCLASIQRVAKKSPTNYQSGVDCLTDMRFKLEKIIDLKPLFKLSH